MPAADKPQSLDGGAVGLESSGSCSAKGCPDALYGFVDRCFARHFQAQVTGDEIDFCWEKGHPARVDRRN